MSTEYEIIMKQTGLKPSSCSCNTCINMCKTSPCLGTPDDILKLINNGYISSLSNTMWIAGLAHGIPPIEMVQLTFANGSCIMFDSGNCKLHKSGMKPLEGVISNCNINEHIRLQLIENKPSATNAIAKTWMEARNKRTIKLIYKALKTTKI